MASLKQLLETTNALIADIEMSNEELVAQIQRLNGSDDPRDREHLSKVQAKLFSQNAGLIIKIASGYNRGRPFTSDETGELALAVFAAARKFDPERGVNFSACLPWYIRSSLQKEHAFISGHSQSVYARNKAKVNNLDRYDTSEIARAEGILRSHASLSSEAVELQVTDNISTEDSFLSHVEQSQDEDIKERMLILASQAIEKLTPEQKQILQAMVEPIHTVDEYGLRTTASIATHLNIGRTHVKEQKQLIFTTIQDYLFEHEPSLRPPGWTSEQHIIPAPAMEEVIMGLFGILTASELANYRRVTKRVRRRR